MTEPTIQSHPFKVGRMVYATQAAAVAAVERCADLYPGQPVQIIDRRTGEVAEA